MHEHFYSALVNYTFEKWGIASPYITAVSIPGLLHHSLKYPKSWVGYFGKLQTITQISDILQL